MLFSGSMSCKQNQGTKLTSLVALAEPTEPARGELAAAISICICGGTSMGRGVATGDAIFTGCIGSWGGAELTAITGTIRRVITDHYYDFQLLIHFMRIATQLEYLWKISFLRWKCFRVHELYKLKDELAFHDSGDCNYSKTKKFDMKFLKKNENILGFTSL